MANYFLAPNGNDNNLGTIDSPWFTIRKAWNTVQAGDIVNLRGGTYAYDSQADCYCVGKNGNPANYIKIQAYQNEKPVITRTSAYQNNNVHWRGGVFFSGDYVHWKGIDFTGFEWPQPNNFIGRGFYAEKANFCIFETLRAYGNENGFGLQQLEGASQNGHGSKGNLFLNCDAFNNFDSLSGGGNADGFGIGHIHYDIDPQNPNRLVGCRAWMNGDDGFDNWQCDSYIEYHNCWSWKNGYNWRTGAEAGDGNGFKLGKTDIVAADSRRLLKNCVAFANKERGYDKNDAQVGTTMYNCVAYKNNFAGFAVDQAQLVTYKNNWSFGNLGGNTNLGSNVVCEKNACGGGNCNPLWELSVSESDFYTDSTGIDGPRQADGSLPVINFLRLKPGSALIDAGVDVGTPYGGNKPDIGAFETGTVVPPPPGNQPPVANAGQDQLITLPNNSTGVSGAGSTDPDGTIVSYLWTKQSGPNCTIVQPDQRETPISNLTQGVYTFRLTVTDNNGATAFDDMIITVVGTPPPPPTGNELNIANVSLDDGFAYYLRQDFGTQGDNAANPTQSLLRIYEDGIELQPAHAPHIQIRTVGLGNFSHWSNGSFDALWFSTSDNSDPRTNGRVYTYSIGTPPPPNQPPIVDAGADKTITLPNNTVTLNGTAIDSDGQVVSVEWKNVADQVISTTNTVAVVLSTAGSYTYTFTATDDKGATASDIVVITVNPAPVALKANAGPDIRPKPCDTIMLDGSLSTGNIVSYEWRLVSGGFCIPCTSIVSPNSISTELKGLSHGTYTYELKVTDDKGLSKTDRIRVIMTC